MSRIRVKNFGPIRAGCAETDGWVDIKKVTFFIGNQGSGKSTLAKLISTLTWIEKALVRGDYDKKYFERRNRLRNGFLSYHRIENYIHYNLTKDVKQEEISEIEYEGEAFHFNYKEGILRITEVQGKDYELPQIMYVPAERNFISYVKTPKELKLSSESLRDFITEFDNAKEDLKEPLHLPINGVYLEYDKLNDTVNIAGSDYKLKLTDASSGFQSLVPLYIVSRYLCSTLRQTSTNKEAMSSEELERFRNGVAAIWANSSLTDEQRRTALSVLTSKFNKTAFINIVEEPEQNLFPESQWEMLKSLLQYNNSKVGNKFIATSHSPYIVNFLSLAIKGGILKTLIDNSKTDVSLIQKLEKVVPVISTVKPDEVAIYEFNINGTIKRLKQSEGIPTDENYLNEDLRKTNELFSQLLEIEEEIL